MINYENGGYSGTIPTQFGLLTELTELNLGRNSLGGTIPTQMGGLTKLVTGQWFPSLAKSIRTKLSIAFHRHPPELCRR